MSANTYELQSIMADRSRRSRGAGWQKAGVKAHWRKLGVRAQRKLENQQLRASPELTLGEEPSSAQERALALWLGSLPFECQAEARELLLSNGSDTDAGMDSADEEQGWYGVSADLQAIMAAGPGEDVDLLQAELRQSHWTSMSLLAREEVSTGRLHAKRFAAIVDTDPDFDLTC